MGFGSVDGADDDEHNSVCFVKICEDFWRRMMYYSLKQSHLTERSIVDGDLVYDT